MHPDPSIAIGRMYQREMLRHAEVGRRAAEFKTSKHRPVEFALPRVKLGRRIAAVRARLAYT
jgi:hypothetical protein